MFLLKLNSFEFVKSVAIKYAATGKNKRELIEINTETKHKKNKNNLYLSLFSLVMVQVFVILNLLIQVTHEVLLIQPL